MCHFYNSVVWASAYTSPNIVGIENSLISTETLYWSDHDFDETY